MSDRSDDRRASTGAGTADPTASFRHYVMQRRYDFGRGREASWRFIAEARGDREFPDPASWRELRAYLERRSASGELLASARTVWRSFAANQSRRRRRPEGFRR